MTSAVPTCAVTTSAPGKVILFGEHAVNRGQLALAAAWGRRAWGVAGVACEELPAGSDSVLLHPSVTPRTRNLVDAGFLRAMKRTAFLVNPARAELVDESAPPAARRDRTNAGLRKLGEICAENVLRVLRGGAPWFQV